MLEFVCYSRCSFCKTAQKWLEDNKIEYKIRDIKKNSPDYSELKEWHQKSGVDVKMLFNTSGIVFKSMNLKEKINSMLDDEQLKLLSTDGMLVKRPVLVGDDFVLVGFKEAEWEEVLLK